MPPLTVGYCAHIFYFFHLMDKQKLYAISADYTLTHYIIRKRDNSCCLMIWYPLDNKLRHLFWPSTLALITALLSLPKVQTFFDMLDYSCMVFKFNEILLTEYTKPSASMSIIVVIIYTWSKIIFIKMNEWFEILFVYRC